MKRRDAILTLIEALADRPDLGRTSLQKAAYLLDARFPLRLDHSAYYYGPFSEVVESEVSTLVTAGLLDEKEHRLGFVGAHGYEGRRYEYTVTESGHKRLKHVEEAHHEEVKLIRQFAEQLVSVAGGLDQRLLSAAAKVHYITVTEEQPLDADQIRQVAEQFGWDLKSSGIEQVREILTGLDLLDHQQLP